MAVETQSLKIATSWGDIVVQLREGKVVGCDLPNVGDEQTIPFSIAHSSGGKVGKFICNIFRGRLSSMPAIGELHGTPFQKMVWNELRKIPLGETRSYGEIAAAIGRPSSYRAVANACGKNPAALFIPCHRVVGADGKLHGFSSGTAWKKMLLKVELN